MQQDERGAGSHLEIMELKAIHFDKLRLGAWENLLPKREGWGGFVRCSQNRPRGSRSQR
jgi:hypothetical protein